MMDCPICEGRGRDEEDKRCRWCYSGKIPKPEPKKEKPDGDR